MNTAEFQLRGLSDPRLTLHAASPLPAWLWSSDGTRILWSNPLGARIFGAANSASLSRKIFGPADQHRRQVTQLANRLPPAEAVRLERLRGFGAALGMLITCRCARLDLADGGQGVLIVATEPVGRPMPLIERLQHLVEGVDAPIAAFTQEGQFVAASEAARSLGGFHSLSEAILDEARNEALQHGRAETTTGAGKIVLQRLGAGPDAGLLALIEPEAAQIAPVEDDVAHGTPPAMDVAAAQETRQEMQKEAQPVAPPGDLPVAEYERPALSGEAPAEFALIDEFTEAEETPETQVVQPADSIETAAPSPMEEDQEHAASELEAPPEEAPSPALEAPAEAPAPPPIARQALEPPSGLAPSQESLRYPLRFMWQMDADGRFSISRDEFTHLVGVNTAAAFGRPWSELAETFALDPDGRVAKAIATRSTWSGIVLQWPLDGGGRLPVELSGLPIYDHLGKFTGYRGFGVCRDLDELARLDEQRRAEYSNDQPAKSESSSGSSSGACDEPSPAETSTAEPEAVEPAAAALESVALKESAADKPAEEASDALTNVVPFPMLGETRPTVLSQGENTAFNELARQLSARLEGENGERASGAAEAVIEKLVPAENPARSGETPNWLVEPEPPARGESMRDRMLLDLLPDGVLIYRLDRLLYANAAFLERIGYPSLHALEQDGGLDALFVEPGVSTASSTSDTGTPVRISAQGSGEARGASAIGARLHAISWDGESAHALIFSGSSRQDAGAHAASGAAPSASAPSAVGHIDAEELGAILDTAADGIVMFDAQGNINTSNGSAEALFGHDGMELARRNIADLFAPESQPAVMDYLASLRGSGVASLLEHGREVLGRVRGGGLIPLSMTMGRTQPRGPNFFAVFRDLSQNKKGESELREARRLADRAANASADLLARISHEIRAPLNAIIGFAEVMANEGLGPLGNERYVEYMRDIRASGEHVIAIIDDLADLSRIETGRLDLTFTAQNLNELIENCVSAMQPQANRERIIIRTSLAPVLPPVLADAHALRQIAQNLIGNSIHLARTGGQVIVSTALTDFGEVVLRVRDTGCGLNDSEVAAAMEPFRTQGPPEQAPDGSPVSLSLTRALVEANRAKFCIRRGARAGTLIEVVFSPAMAGT